MPVIGPALIAAMLALAAPAADGPGFVLECSPDQGYAGVTYAAETPPRIQLGIATCGDVARVVYHRHASPAAVMGGLQILLHEARHVAQYRRGWTVYGDPRYRGLDFDLGGNEHDAECSTLRTLKPALRELGYRWPFIRASVQWVRFGIEHVETPPYGGRCP